MVTMTALPPIPCPITNSKLPLVSVQEREPTYRNDFAAIPSNFVPAKPVSPPTCAISKLPKLGTTNYESSFQSAYGSSSLTGADRAEIPQHDIYVTNFKLEKSNRLGPLTSSHREDFTAKSPIFKNNRFYRKKQNVPQMLPTAKAENPFPQETEYEKAFGYSKEADDIYQPTRSQTQGLARDPITGASASADAKQHGYQQHGYLSTSKEAYKRFSEGAITALPASYWRQKHRMVSIPLGDREKEVEHHSCYSDSFRNSSMRLTCIPYNKALANRAVYRSSVHIGDGASVPSPYKVNFPLYFNPERTLPVSCYRNASSFPDGDLHQSRVKDRLSHLTSLTAYSKPPLGSFPEHIDSSNMHTLSSVNFGQGQASEGPIQSTTMETYLPITSTRPSSFAPVKDNIPFDYASDEPNHSTAQSSYRKLVPDHTDKSHYANLKRSHWQLPDTGANVFITTQQSHYPPPLIALNK